LDVLFDALHVFVRQVTLQTRDRRRHSQIDDGDRSGQKNQRENRQYQYHASLYRHARHPLLQKGPTADSRVGFSSLPVAADLKAEKRLSSRS
jgi:hypothetical protein